MKLRCRLFGHLRGPVTDPKRPLDITVGCARCLDPETFTTLVNVDPDPERLGFVKVPRAGLSALSGYLEGLRR